MTAEEQSRFSRARTKTIWYIVVLVLVALVALWGVAQGWFTTLLVGDMAVIDDQVAIPHSEHVLDTSLFDDPRWKSMTNHGVTIQERSKGRRNPFSAPAN